MRALNVFIVELDKLINDTINVGGKELFIDTRCEMGEFNNRVNEGVVVSSPAKHDTGVDAGDTLYFHHHVVIQGGQKLLERTMMIRTTSACTIQKTSWPTELCLQEERYRRHQCLWRLDHHGALPPEKVQRSTVIEEVDLKEKKVSKGRLAFESEGSKELGIDLKEIVAFKEGIAYPFKIDGKDYIRVSKEMVDYVIVEP